MKRVLLTIICASLVFFNACAQKQNNKKGDNNMKTLVAYFSASGVTKGVAQQLSKVANSDLYEITPEQKYTAADLDWRDKNSRSTIEMQDKNSRPAIKKDLKNLDEYSVVYIGFPIWWYTAPTIINTFLESYDFSGKTIILFATSGSSNITKSVNDLKAKYPNLNIKGGKLLNSPSKKQLEDFVKEGL
ncbi:MAG: flavodoxin [Bacteroidales bacterium]|nr:flavodoxin [Bacteroidales bacterium]